MYNSIDTLPPQTNHLPDHAKKIFMAAFNNSYKKDGETAAFKIAWNAVSSAGYVKKNGQWMQVAKSSIDYWRNRFSLTDKTINRLMTDEERKAILRSARAHAGGKAKAAKMKERKAAAVMKDMSQLLSDLSDTDKSDKDEVFYRVGDATEHCGVCEYFMPDENSCQLVSGYIDPDAVCNLFCAEDNDGDSYNEDDGMKVNKTDVDAPAPGSLGGMTPSDVHSDKSIAEEKRIQRKYKKPVERPADPNASYVKSFIAPIVKTDEEKRIIYGVVLEPFTIDSQGDWETPESIEKAAHDFMSMYREMGIEHVTKNEAIYPVESYIAPTDITFTYDNGDEAVIKAGSWVLGSYVGDDSAWESVKKGELTGYSVEGLGFREPIDSWYNDIMKRDIPESERKQHPESDFAGKGRSFPIFSQADVSAAFHSLGRAGSDNYSSDQIRSNIIRIARRKGFALPDSAKNGGGDESSSS